MLESLGFGAGLENQKGHTGGYSCPEGESPGGISPVNILRHVFCAVCQGLPHDGDVVSRAGVPYCQDTLSWDK